MYEGIVGQFDQKGSDPSPEGSDPFWSSIQNILSERNNMNEEFVLCAASAYEKKFYLNPEFDSLPESIKEELQIMCVLYTEDVGGVLMLVFDEEGNLELKVDHEENDFAFDEIGSVLKVKQLQQTKRELFESLELFFRVFYLGEDIPEETKPQNP